MKAAVPETYGSEAIFRYGEMPEPVCGPHQVSIRVEAIEVGTFEAAHSGSEVYSHQCAGTISAIGTCAGGWTVGQRVVALAQGGVYAETAVVSADRTWALPIELDYVTAACVPIAFGSAHVCLFELGRLRAGHTLLLHAPMSQLAVAIVQLATRAGAAVFVTTPSEDNTTTFATLGAHHVTPRSGTAWLGELKRLTNDTCADLAIDLVGGLGLRDTVEGIRQKGEMVVVGTSDQNYSGSFDIAWIARRGVSLAAVRLGSELAGDRSYSVITDLLESVASGGLRVAAPSIYPLRQTHTARQSATSERTFGRVVLVPDRHE